MSGWVDCMERERLKMFKRSSYKQPDSRFKLNLHGGINRRPWPLPQLGSPPQPSTSNNNGSGISETASTSPDTDGVAENGVPSETSACIYDFAKHIMHFTGQKRHPEVSVNRCIHSF
ncbi:hypothetical protein GCK72_024653 [Caenorhabditis remanei]|uniref:Uncharacterized protein n=1 Tax=Caenorhabditis remanei TaxID=31234 RepID=A0A6A5FZU8_CAERE|nr:hypothetical protein GCK72_024653 [Caenorhabditis remanei]KAF1748186.1 hypothetical protein GCK72_024653 [Caenorhabditis remanei]